MSEIWPDERDVEEFETSEGEYVLYVPSETNFDQFIKTDTTVNLGVME
jgi:hypothetical protein